ncbi:hypothetical protein A2870_00060 [Candidatus Curtissbacteria bacterium RIFCSPHIGHO2_01_FULL_41_11]|uniref:PDZ domain-containing protein n=1 Tax=Candidatus Curtissbacteria bacterium RIFCSPHIGHO2_01_FULL_41_11 TaxID=1797711 RepID=A0A1F5G619_9BACT|nr:MAG: hypothetical protein A2870_00060 [Candidatus Curtissbacteria bacterium RIFCSPHIGHO2_01_FULL_41_11]
MLTVIVFILILSVLVMLHELGHFLMAKRAGIGVEEFGFGLPPRIWGKKIRGTIYSINWLPFGGFVRLVGEDPDDKQSFSSNKQSFSSNKKIEPKNSFAVKTLPQRILVVIAGVFMNFMLAIVIFYVVVAALGFKVSLPLLVEHKFKFVDQSKQVLVEGVNPGSAADGAGIKPGDSIIYASSQKIDSIDSLQKVIRANQDKQIELVLENPANNSKRTVFVVPQFSEELNVPAIGVGLGELLVLNYDTPMQKLLSGFIHSYNTVDYSIKIFGELIGYSMKSRDFTPVREGVSGPVGIAQITSQAVAMGPISVLQLAGLLSLNLAVVNVLPIPALDGGRFFFLLIEAVTRRKIYPKIEKWAHTIGFALLLGLIVLITFNDIAKLLR